MDTQTVLDTLREARIQRTLSQADLGAKLGISQSRVSGLERAQVDPRLSTVLDVARILDLELVLVPRQLVTTINGLIRRNNSSASEEQPIYKLDEPTTNGRKEVG